MKPQPLLVPAAACALVLAACGTQSAPPSPAPSAAGSAAGPTAAPVACGSVTGPRGAAQVTVRAGTVGCDEAKSVLAQYFAGLAPADLTDPQGAGPVALGPWTCGSDPGQPLSATCSTEDNREVAGSPG